LKDHKPHFNVKFLKGYGHSISVKNMPYEKIVLSGKGYISTEALSLLSENNRNVILLDTFGKPITFCNGMMDSLTATQYRIAQYDTFRDESKRQYLVKQIIFAKKESQIKLLKLIGSSVLVLIIGSIISAPLLAGLTGFNIFPYRHMPLIVFFSIGVGMLFSKKITQ